MKNDRLLILFIVLIAGAIYLHVTHYQLPHRLDTSRSFSSPASGGRTVGGSLDNYPDVMARLVFDSIPPDTLISHINDYKSRYAFRYHAWISELAMDSSTGHYLLVSDFQSTPYQPAMIQELTDSIYAISGSRLQYIGLE